MDQSQKEFLVEIEQLIEQIFSDLDELRENRADARLCRQLIDRIFRRVHSVKGSAASSGLDSLAQLAHHFESLLDAVRAGRTALDEDVLEACETATNALAESLMLAAAENGQNPEVAPRGLFELLTALTERGAGDNLDHLSDIDTILQNIPAEFWETFTEAEKNRLATVAGDDTPLFVVVAPFDIANFETGFTDLQARLAKCGEIISTSPAVDDNDPAKINFRVIYASPLTPNDLRAAVNEFADLTLVAVGGESRLSDSPGARAIPSVATLSNSVRTDLDRLDRIISSTHELSRLTSNALSRAKGAHSATDANEDVGQLDEQIERSFKSLEADLINLRMVDLGPTLQRAARAGRAAAREAGKDIDFEVIGAELRIDKMLVDAIGNPLIHLVRNAVDHGIEDTEARARAGKERRGRIRIEALNEGSSSRVRIADDGCGIDPIVVSDAAKRLGIVEAESAPDFEQSMRLIFRPGFTTVTMASEISGRGVGLDVVETAVEQVGGELRVSSALERGTTFEIRLPVTFSLLAATVCVSAGRPYCIPSMQTAAFETIDKSATIQAIREKQITIGTDRLPLVCLRELLGQPAAENGSSQQSQLIVLAFSEEQAGSRGDDSVKRIGLIVDAVAGTEEVLVRSLGRHAGRWYGVAGATELRDGDVALVLDLPRTFTGLDHLKGIE